MSDLGNLLKTALVATALLLAAAASAGDVTSDRAQAAASARPDAMEAQRPPGATTCRCAAPSGAAAPEVPR